MFRNANGRISSLENRKMLRRAVGYEKTNPWFIDTLK